MCRALVSCHCGAILGIFGGIPALRGCLMFPIRKTAARCGVPLPPFVMRSGSLYRSDCVGAVLLVWYAVGLSGRWAERKTAQPVKGHAVAVLLVAAVVFLLLVAERVNNIHAPPVCIVKRSRGCCFEVIASRPHRVAVFYARINRWKFCGDGVNASRGFVVNRFHRLALQFNTERGGDAFYLLALGGVCGLFE